VSQQPVTVPETAPGLVPGLSAAAVRALSDLKNDPAWLADLRQQAWAAFERLPLPSRTDEDWRRTDLRALDLNAFQPFREPHPAGRPADLPAVFQQFLTEEGAKAGLLLQRDSAAVFQQLAPDLARQGVLLTDLDTAARAYPDLVREHLHRLVRFDEDKFTALHAAFCSGGALVYVPEGVEVALPLQVVYWLTTPGLGLFTHTLVIAEPGSSLTFIDEYLSLDEAPALHCGVVEVFAKEGAQVRYVHLQQWGRSVWNFGRVRVHADRDSAVNELIVALGSRLTKTYVDSLMAGPGASAEILGLLFGDGQQHLDHQTLQEHRAPHTSSDLLFKAALKDRARSVYNGLIRIHRVAQRADAYQANRNLVLSDTARADSIPRLEIEANDVRCTHGATVGPVDPEQLFYLMSRGLSRAAAERLIVEGFFEPVLERVPLAGLQERLRAAISVKIG